MLADREVLIAVAGVAFLVGLTCGTCIRSLYARLVLLIIAALALLAVVVLAGAWHGLAEGRM